MSKAAGEEVEVQVDEHSPAASTAAASRLRKHSEYQRAYAAARKQHSRQMSFFFARRDRMVARKLHPDEVLLVEQGPRVGLTVPRVLGKAHDRNRIKRRLRTAVRLHAAELGGLPIDVILHPRRTVLDLDWDKLQGEVREVFRTVRRGYDAPPAPASPDRQRSRRKPPKAAPKATPPAPGTAL